MSVQGMRLEHTRALDLVELKSNAQVRHILTIRNIYFIDTYVEYGIIYETTNVNTTLALCICAVLIAVAINS